MDEAKAYVQRAVLDTAGRLTIRAPRSDFWHFEALPLGAANAVASLQAQMKNLAEDADRFQAVLDAPQPRNDSEARGLLRGLVKLRRFKPKIARKKLYSNQKTSVFNFRPDPMLCEEIID